MASKEEILLSRQALLFAESDTLQVLGSSTVVIVNPDLLGCEIARNLGLAGVSKILFLLGSSYSSSEQIKHYKSNYFNDHIREKIEEKSFDDNLFLEFVDSNIDLFHLIVICDDGNLGSEKLNHWNDSIRSKQIPFILTQACGLLSYVFVDVGDKYNYSSISEGRSKKVIRSIDVQTATIEVADQAHQFPVGSLVKFSDFNGSQFLVKNSPFEVKEFVSKNKFSIGVEDPSLIGDYVSGGSVEEVERNHDLSHTSLRDNLCNPNWDSPYYGRRNPNSPHIATFKFFLTLAKFKELHSRTPKFRDPEDYKEFVRILKDLHPLGSPSIDCDIPDFYQRSVYQCRGHIPAISNVIGGFVAQETLKILHRSYKPVTQWILFESLNSLPLNYLDAPNIIFEPDENDIYPDHIRVFGREVQQKLASRKLLLVGAGALGCEFLKIFSMIGAASKSSRSEDDNPAGTIYLCDSDNINESNLHRQFLFTSHDIGGSKSATAAKRIKEINPHLNLEPFSTQMTMTTLLNTFTDKRIWNDLNEVICAVDTAKARQVLDTLSFAYEKVFLESGTRGNACNTSCYIPSNTIRYPLFFNPDDETNCLGKEFPFRPRHTVAWAKELFKNLFFKAVIQANDPSLNVVEESLATSALEAAFVRSLRACCGVIDEEEQLVRIKREFFELFWKSVFEDKIEQILEDRPIDLTDDNGELFWSGYRIRPKLFDLNDQDVIEFRSQLAIDLSALFDAILSNYKSSKLFTPQKFNKDTLLHINFLFAVGNLYSKCYGIPTVPKIQVQILGGEITPAIITVSCICVGFVCLEFYKVLALGTSLLRDINHIDIRLPTREENLNLVNQSSDNTARDIDRQIICNLVDHSFHSNGNILQNMKVQLLENHKPTAKHSVPNNILIIHTNDADLMFSTIAKEVQKKFNIRLMRATSMQFDPDRLLFPQMVETTILESIKAHTKFKTSSFFFEAEYETPDFEEDTIEVMVHYDDLDL